MDRAVIVAYDNLERVERDRAEARRVISAELRAARDRDRAGFIEALADGRRRRGLGLTAADLARLAGISRSTLYELLDEHDRAP